MKKATNAEIAALREALYYTRYGASGSTNIGQYRPRGRGEWKKLTPDRSLINLSKYEYRTFQARLWVANRAIQCNAGSMPVTVAKRVLAIAKKRRSFSLGGYNIVRRSDGGLTVGCQEFSKADLAYAKQLLA